MILLRRLVVFALAITATAVSQPKQMPACGAQCLSTGLTASSCDPKDAPCICQDDILQSNVSTCVVMSCTIKEALLARNMSSTMCQLPVRDISDITPNITSVFMSLGIVATFMRCLQFKKHFGAEDIFAVLALLAAVAMGALEYPMAKDGMGRDIWTIEPENISRIIKFTWIVEMLYIAIMSWIKLAFLCLYLRIFPNEGLRKVIFVLMALVSGFFFAFLIGIALNCIPVSHIWTGWTGETEGECLNFNSFGIACSVINIALDLAVIGLPLREIQKLSLSLAKKLLLMGMFGAGFFITIVSILRLKVVIDFANTTNATYDNVPTAYWSVIECFSAVICVNMPAIRRVFKKLTASCFGTTETESYHDPSDSPVRVMKRRATELSILKTVNTSVHSERRCDESDKVQLVERNKT
ncbi:hypothetical protein FE257_007345 [Aspergillus nanangensis]|uniref:CFEM domain-containing protein n=1 Tax=Aspergillus nanangensis TaxID=2582783 RepID=A0AAD4CPI8_ASPNN|nr:hypothetical protein FE257_007345 [Aspergillus nanangensis]